MQENKLTLEQITSMSEVVAKYMELKAHKQYGKLYISNKGFTEYHSSWDWIHEVWEKVKLEWVTKPLIALRCRTSILDGTKEQAFTALFNAIKFINEQSNKLD